jgi:Leucine-rich repeat (LRR) protein
LGLGHNKLKDGQLNTIGQSFPNLLGLDLSYNELSEIDVTVDNLVNLKNLRMLSLYGNPFCLLENYRKAMLNEF